MPDWKQYVADHFPASRLRGEFEADIREEIAAHLEDAYRDARTRGATESEAEARAIAEVGDWEQLASRILTARRKAASSRVSDEVEASEAAMRKRGGAWVGAADVLQELRFTFRRLGRAPGFTAAVLLSLGIGFGATSAIYSVVKGVIIDPLPYDEPDRLVAVWNTAPGLGEALMPQSFALNAVYEDESRTLERVGIWGSAMSSVMGVDGPSELPSIYVTQGVFPALRVEPILGRTFGFEDTRAGAPRTVILGHRYWNSRFGADPNVLGQTLDIGGAPREIIGVMPEGFRLMDREAELFQPYQYNRAELTLTQFTYNSIARLGDGATMEQALAELEGLLPLAAERYPGGVTLEFLQEAGAAPILHPLKDDLVGSVGSILWVVFGGVGVLLMVACANVANLLIVHSDAQERALAVQCALGSSKRRLIGRFLTESVVLGVIGGVIGVGFAVTGLRILKAIGPVDLPRLSEVDFDPGVLLAAFLISVLGGAVLGLFPLFRAWHIDPGSSLKEGGRGSGAARPRKTARHTLAVSQLALAMVLLVGSGLMIRSFEALNDVPPGFSEPDQLLTFVATAADAADVEVVQTHQTLADHLANLPGVIAVGVTSSVPMDGRAGFDPIYIEDFPLPEGQQAPIKRFKWIGGGYHEAVGNPVIAGRAITWADLHDFNRVVMVTESFAREAWTDPVRAVGRRISTGFSPGDWYEIVGVVGDVRDDGVDQDAVDIVYWPMAMRGFWAEIEGQDDLFVQSSMTYVVRSPRVETPGFVDEIRDAVWASLPGRPLSMVRTMESLHRDSMARTAFTLVMLAIAASMALLLGCIGIYGVVSYAVAQRTGEIGLRMAIGAEPSKVTAMVLRQGLVLAVIATGIGVCGAVVATRLMESVLFGVSPLDPLTYGLAASGLTGVAVLATWLPARRAASVDPMEALKAN